MGRMLNRKTCELIRCLCFQPSLCLQSTNLVHADVMFGRVMWFNLGWHAVSNPGDLPNALQHTSTSSVWFAPRNLHDKDPSPGRSQGVKLELGFIEETTVLPFGHQYSKGVNVNTIGALQIYYAWIKFSLTNRFSRGTGRCSARPCCIQRRIRLVRFIILLWRQMPDKVNCDREAPGGVLI